MKLFALCVISLLLVCGCRTHVVQTGRMSAQASPSTSVLLTQKGERILLSWVTTNFGRDAKASTPYGVSVQELKDAVSSYCRLQREFNEGLTTGIIHLTSEQVRVLRLYDADIVEAHGTKGPTLMIQTMGHAFDGAGSKSCWGSLNQVQEDKDRKIPDPQH